MASRRIAMLGALVAAALALAGCNYVLTVTALFTPTDAAGAPALKPGYRSSALLHQRPSGRAIGKLLQRL